MNKLAAVGLAGLIAVGSVASAGKAEARSRNGWVPFAVGAGILTLGAIAASQSYGYPHYYAYEPYGYGPYPYYVAPRVVVSPRYYCHWHKNGVRHCGYH